MTIPVIILAAGASSRMQGRDKLLEDVNGKPLLRRQAEIALAASPDVIVALPPRPHPRYEALAGLDVTTVEVPDAAEGMNATLRAGISALPDNTRAAAIFLGDLPDLQANDLQTVLSAVDLDSDMLIWRGATEDGEPGHPVVFAAELFPQLLELSGDDGAQPVVARNNAKTVLVPLPGARARLDLDTPEDWAAWRNNSD